MTDALLKMIGFDSIFGTEPRAPSFYPLVSVAPAPSAPLASLPERAPAELFAEEAE